MCSVSLGALDRGLSGDVPGREVLRTATLADGRRLVVRTMRPSDAEGLGRLYEGLSLDDRHRRFFSVYQPSPTFLEHYAHTCEDEGLGLVVVVGDQTERLVAEASYVLLPGGDGEFAITVAEDWRGWLGPYLLDALVEAAAARGVPNLEADVLLENRPMLALVRSRGFVTIDYPDRGIVRVAIAAARPTPTRPPAPVRRQAPPSQPPRAP